MKKILYKDLFGIHGNAVDVLKEQSTLNIDQTEYFYGKTFTI